MWNEMLSVAVGLLVILVLLAMVFALATFPLVQVAGGVFSIGFMAWAVGSMVRE